MQQMKRLLCGGESTATVVAVWVMFATVSPAARAGTLCVNARGTGSCFTTIGAAVAAASPGDTVAVAHGTYAEYVIVPKPLVLMGESAATTIIDATGQPWGINIDGQNNAGLSNVTVTGLTVENANFAGILVNVASNVNISNNRIIGNDVALDPSGPSCPGIPAEFERGEAFDCGEGVFLTGVDHSTIANNVITRNAGGILLTDDTGASHDNLITGNSVVRNLHGDCGITLPSHSGAGVHHNTVSGNDSEFNSGPGVGIFAPGPGSKAYGNIVINNTLRGNGLPGVAMHNHAAPGMGGVPSSLPPVVFNDNVIVGNDISGNAADDEDAVTTGPTGIRIFSLAPMSGTVISQNVITNEAIDLAVDIQSGSASVAVSAQSNDFQTNQIGVQNTGVMMVDATQNWWGCPDGPDANGCATIAGSGVLFTPWLTGRIRP